MVNPVLLIAIPLGLSFIIPLINIISKRVVKFIPVLAMLFNLIGVITIIPKVWEDSLCRLRSISWSIPWQYFLPRS